MEKKKYGICGFGHLQIGEEQETCDICGGKIIYSAVSKEEFNEVEIDGKSIFIPKTVSHEKIDLSRNEVVKHFVQFFRMVCLCGNNAVQSYIIWQMKEGKYIPQFTNGTFLKLMVNCSYAAAEKFKSTNLQPSTISDIVLIDFIEGQLDQIGF